MGDLPKIVLEHFAKVRDETGVSISKQMSIYENGFKIVRSCNPQEDVNISCKTYELSEYTGEDEYPLVGNILTMRGNFCSAEITDCVITTLHEIGNIRVFLDEAERIINESNEGLGEVIEHD